MIELTRTVRFSIAGDPAAEPNSTPNGHAGTPPMHGLGRYYELDVRCAGELDAQTGFLLNIKDIDHAVRRHFVPAVARACADAPGTEPAALLRSAGPAVSRALAARVRALRWRLSPHLSLEIEMDTPDAVLLRQRFEFAASHRLHVPALSDRENAELFGKCSSPSGHGHNYILEPCVALRARANGSGGVVGGSGGVSFLPTLERLTQQHVIDRFDHKHLNIDTPEFGDGRGVNPTVENIARVCFDRLAPAIRAADASAELRHVTVWESERTSARYPA